MYKKIIFTIFFLTACNISLIFAQTLHATVATAGGNATGTGGSATYTVGQVFYTTATGTTGSVAQGVQQPYEINVVSGIAGIYNIELFAAYPNPASTHVILKIENNELTSFTYKLYDAKGAVLRTEKITAYETIINMASLKPAIYFIGIQSGKEEIKVFRIIKH